MNFSKHIGPAPVEIFYKETNSFGAIKNIMEVNYKLGIVRYASGYDKYFDDMFEEKGLAHELITRFRYLLITSKKNPPALKKEIHFSDLQDFIEAAHADPFVPSLPETFMRVSPLSEEILDRYGLVQRGVKNVLTTRSFIKIF